MKWYLISIPLLFSCGILPQKVSMDAPRIQPLLEAAARFDRTAYGFTPIPQTADIRLESRGRKEYDAMLHISAKTSRTISFKRVNGSFKWIGEQEIFQGPKKFETADGTSDEVIILTYHAEERSGFPANKLNITYFGQDPRLGKGVNLNLTQEQVRPILKEWGY